MDVAKRTPIGTSGYEKVVGTVHFAIDPKDPRNRVIADLDKALVNGQGKVEFSSDFYLIRPSDPARSNGVALVEVSNRGRKGLLGLFSRAPGTLDPQTDADLGDGFLTRDGFTLAWVGWQFDVKPEGELISMKAPVAANSTLVVRAEFTPNDRGPSMTVADLAGYPPADAAGSDTRLTVRDDQFAAAQTIDRASTPSPATWSRCAMASTPAGFTRSPIGPPIQPSPARHGGIQRLRRVAQARPAGQREREVCVCLGLLTERTLPAHVSLLRIQRRRKGRSGVRWRDGAHRRGGPSQLERTECDTERAVDVHRHGISVRERRDARSDQRPHGRPSGQRAGEAAPAERSFIRIRPSSIGAADGPRRSSTLAGWQVRPDASRQRARVLPDGVAARAGSVPDPRDAGPTA